jgi:hypothetical protein
MRNDSTCIVKLKRWRHILFLLKPIGSGWKCRPTRFSGAVERSSAAQSQELEGAAEAAGFVRLRVEGGDPMRLLEEITRFRLKNGERNFDSLLAAPRLNAAAAAYTAWLAGNRRQQITQIGNNDEV